METTISIQGVGDFTLDASSGWYVGPTIELGLPSGKSHTLKIVLVENYQADSAALSIALGSFREKSGPALIEAEKYIFQYYEESKRYYGNEPNFPQISTPRALWDFVEIADDVLLQMRPDDQKFYFVLESSCKWEREHGLQIVFKDGGVVNKVGPFDGHLTNSDAYGREGFESVVFVSNDDLSK